MEKMDLKMEQISNLKDDWNSKRDKGVIKLTRVDKKKSQLSNF